MRKPSASKRRRGSSEYDPSDPAPLTPVASTSAAMFDADRESSPLSSLSSQNDEDEEMSTPRAGPSQLIAKRIKTEKNKVRVAPRSVEKNFTLVIESKRRTPVGAKAKGKGKAKAVKKASQDMPALPRESHYVFAYELD